MSEHRLWLNVRNNIGHVGHFTRIEFNVIAGIPDVSYCIAGAEGYCELKYREDLPARITTQVFGREGLREDQEIWISERVRHAGRVYILAQAEDRVFLIPGKYASEFNSMTLHQLSKASSWETESLRTVDWLQLVKALRV